MEPVQWAGAFWGLKVGWLRLLLWVHVILVGEKIELTNYPGALNDFQSSQHSRKRFRFQCLKPLSAVPVEMRRLSGRRRCCCVQGWGHCPGLGDEVLPCPALPSQPGFGVSKSKKRSRAVPGPHAIAASGEVLVHLHQLSWVRSGLFRSTKRPWLGKCEYSQMQMFSAKIVTPPTR